MNLSAILGGGSGRLGFVEIVIRVFSFLLQKGFSIAKRKGTYVRFESNSVFVNIYHGRFSYQIGLDIGRIHENEKYSLYEVLRAIAPAYLERARYQTKDAEVLRQCLEAIAEVVEQNYGGLLSGESSAFERLKLLTSPHRRTATLQAQFGAIIVQADKAWEAKDFNHAAELYEKAEPALDKTRMRRLEYLRSRKN